MFWLFAHRCLRGVSLRPRALFIAFSRGHQGAIIREALDGSVNIKPHTLFSHSTQRCISTGADGSCRYICELHTHTPLIHGCSRPAHTPAPPFLAFSRRSNVAYRARLIQYIILHAVPFPHGGTTEEVWRGSLFYPKVTPQPSRRELH